MKTLYKIKLWLKKRSENKAKKRIFKSKVNNYIDMLIADFAVKDFVSYRPKCESGRAENSLGSVPL